MMLFKDIKQNYPVYILDKQEMTFKQGIANDSKDDDAIRNKCWGRRYDGRCYDRS